MLPAPRDLGARCAFAEATEAHGRVEPRQLLRALRGRERLEDLLGAQRALWSPIARLARSQPTRPLRVLAVGGSAGGGALRLWRAAARSGLKITVDGCERHAAAVELARRQARQIGAPVRFLELDAERDDLPDGYDVVAGSLLLHRLDDPRAASVLRRLDAAASELVLVLDLLRCRGGLRFARWTARWCQGSTLVREEAEPSIRASYTLPEVTGLVQRAGLSDARVERHWPFRFLLRWRPSAASGRRCDTERPRNGHAARCSGPLVW